MERKEEKQVVGERSEDAEKKTEESWKERKKETGSGEQEGGNRKVAEKGRNKQVVGDREEDTGSRERERGQEKGRLVCCGHRRSHKGKGSEGGQERT